MYWQIKNKDSGKIKEYVKINLMNPLLIFWKKYNKKRVSRPYLSLVSLLDFLMYLSPIEFYTFGLLKRALSKPYNPSWVLEICSKAMGQNTFSNIRKYINCYENYRVKS